MKLNNKNLFDGKFWKRFFFGNLFVLSFVLNWFWEVLQMPLFSGLEERTWSKTLFFCTLAIFIDVLTTFIVFGLAAFAFKSFGWKFYAIAALLGSVSAIVFEKIAFAAGLWTYGEQMLVLPFLETGVSPFLQLTILIPLSLWLAKQSSKQRLIAK